MNWTDFLLYLALFYVVYYAANVIIDVLRKPKAAGVQKSDPYTFETDITDFDEQPTVIRDDENLDPKPQSDSPDKTLNKDTEGLEGLEIKEINPVQSSGGVTSLDSLFALAKEGTIELKKSIVYS